MKFGDVVTAAINDGLPISPWEGIVIGEPRYSTERSRVLMLAKGEVIGGPWHASHCAPTGATDIGEAEALRARFEALHPGFLKGVES